MKFENIKPSYDTNRQLLGKILPLSTPFTVIVDSSECCNFECSYCFRSDKNKENWGYAKQPLLMEWSVFQEIAHQMKKFPQKVKHVSLSNHGEPLCNPNLPEMVKYLKQNDICERVSIHTNASLLTESLIDRLVDARIDKVVVSLQGMSAQKYSEVCHAKIDFENFIEKLRIFYRKKTNTKLCIKVADIAVYGQEQECYQTFSPIADSVYVEKIVPIWKNLHLKNAEMQNKYGEFFLAQQCCPLIFHTIVVSPIGDVYPCTQLLTPFNLGNIQKTTLLDIWTSEQRKKLLMEQCQDIQPDWCKDCYILQNSIFSKEDMIDDYRYEILDRLKSL